MEEEEAFERTKKIIEEKKCDCAYCDDFIIIKSPDKETLKKLVNVKFGCRADFTNLNIVPVDINLKNKKSGKYFNNGVYWGVYTRGFYDDNDEKILNTYGNLKEETINKLQPTFLLTDNQEPPPVQTLSKENLSKDHLSKDHPSKDHPFENENFIKTSGEMIEVGKITTEETLSNQEVIQFLHGLRQIDSTEKGQQQQQPLQTNEKPDLEIVDTEKEQQQQQQQPLQINEKPDLEIIATEKKQQVNSLEKDPSEEPIIINENTIN